VALANASRYSLAGGVWTADPSRGLQVARRMRTGVVIINTSPPPFPVVPFGGFKESGLGRELGPQGLLGFLETRTTRLPPRPPPARTGEHDEQDPLHLWEDLRREVRARGDRRRRAHRSNRPGQADPVQLAGLLRQRPPRPRADRPPPPIAGPNEAAPRSLRGG